VRVKYHFFISLLLSMIATTLTASANEAIKVMFFCMQFEDGEQENADFASFRVYADGSGFPSSKDTQEQGFYYLSDLANKSVNCDVDGQLVSFNILNYETDGQDVAFENYEIQVVRGDKVLYHTPKGMGLGIWGQSSSKFPFKGQVEVTANQQSICSLSIHTVGHNLVVVDEGVEMSSETRNLIAQQEKEYAELQAGVSPAPASDDQHYPFERVYGDMACN
jgi:hypothetical protein